MLEQPIAIANINKNATKVVAGKTMANNNLNNNFLLCFRAIQKALAKNKEFPLFEMEEYLSLDATSQKVLKNIYTTTFCHNIKWL